MQILIGFIVGAAVGAALHFIVAGRSTRGVALGPIIGAVAAGLVWTILTWSGIGIDTPWPWLAALVAPVIVTWPLLVILTRTRIAHDQSERTRLKLG